MTSTEIEQLVADSGIPTGEFAQGVGVSRPTLWRYRVGELETPAGVLAAARELAELAAAHRRARMEATVYGEDSGC